MEARRFGFGASMPPANKFDPTDEDIVAQYLLPRAAGVPNAYEHAVIDDDPCSCPPWELLRRHGHDESDQAFFFGPPRDMNRNAGRVSRVVHPAAPGGIGGVWRGMKGEEKALVIVRGDGSGAELTVKFRRYSLSYHRKGDRRASGWVMHEYHVVHPELRPGAVIARIKITERAKKMGKREQKLQDEDSVTAAAAAKQLAPDPGQPGPSNYLDDDDGLVAAKHVVMGEGEGTSGGAQAEAVHQGDNGGGFTGEMAGYYSALPMPSAGEDGGHYSALPMPSAGETGMGITFDNFSNNYCSNEGDGNSDYFLQDVGGNGD